MKKNCTKIVWLALLLLLTVVLLCACDGIGTPDQTTGTADRTESGTDSSDTTIDEPVTKDDGPNTDGNGGSGSENGSGIGGSGSGSGESGSTSEHVHTYGTDGICTSCSAKKPSEGLSFKSNSDGTCYVSGIGTCTDTDIVIPPVSPEGDRVTSIGQQAFSNCDLTSIVIPESILTIGYAAFEKCESLTSLVFPDNIVFIGRAAFWDCNHLETISIGVDSKLTTISDGAFSGCERLKNFTIPKKVKIVGYGAFRNCSSLTSITIPEGVQASDRKRSPVVAT